jgi:hypothetical protein
LDPPYHLRAAVARYDDNLDEIFPAWIVLDRFPIQLARANPVQRNRERLDVDDRRIQRVRHGRLLAGGLVRRARR